MRRFFNIKSLIIAFCILAFASFSWAGTPKVFKYGLKIRDEGAAKSTPASGYGYLYVNSDVLYFKDDGGTATDLISASSTSTDFELAADADAGDFDIKSLDRLEFLDTGLYIDGGSNGVLIISSDGTLELQSADWDISTTGVITNASMSADQISAAALNIGANKLTIGNSYMEIGTDPADAGTIRLPNAGTIYFEASVAGTDVQALSVDSSEVVQIGAAGASGVTITPAVTMSSTMSATDGTFSGNIIAVDGTFSGDLFVTGTFQQDAISAKSATTTLTIDGTTTGGVTLGSISEGTITLGGAATLVNLPSTVDLVLAGGDITATDTANADMVTFTNNTLTTADLLTLSATGTRTSNYALTITDGATTASTIGITANAQTSGHGISYGNTGQALTGAAINLAVTDGASFTGDYIRCYDGGAEDFTVERYGETTIAGNASGTDALTITDGDILVTAGHIDITTGNLSIGTGNLQTDAGHAAIGIGTADIETWETSTQLSALQLGGAGFWAAARAQAASDSSYFGHNAYFDDTDSQWEAISTGASDQAVMLQMTDGTWIFNVEDTATAGDAAITWIPSLIITETGKIGMGTATAAAVDENLHLESTTASKPVLKIENTNAEQPMTMFLELLNLEGSVMVIPMNSYMPILRQRVRM